MAVFTWLHLTDLHTGMTDSDDYWPNAKEELTKDLSYYAEKAGGLDFVLFTGDLVQRGTKDEFDRAEERLKRVWEIFSKPGRTPGLLAVPGNHDLARPDKTDPALAGLPALAGPAETRHAFWAGTSPQRSLVEGAFAQYQTWWSRTDGVPRCRVDTTGLLPGDLSATIEKDGVRLGIACLNSAFLHLSDVKPGKLALDMHQFNKACGGNGAEWAAARNACVFVTHHPANWLSTACRSELSGEILRPGRFALHEFGHMHEADLTDLVPVGGVPTYGVQGPALFAKEGWSIERRKRIHGYTLLQLEITPAGASLLVWLRRVVPRAGNSWAMDRDQKFHVATGSDAVGPIEIKAMRPPAAGSAPGKTPGGAGASGPALLRGAGGGTGGSAAALARAIEAAVSAPLPDRIALKDMMTGNFGKDDFDDLLMSLELAMQAKGYHEPLADRWEGGTPTRIRELIRYMEMREAYAVLVGQVRLSRPGLI